MPKSIYDEVTSISSADETGLFPALQSYQAARTDENLIKLCVEMADFCEAIFASTQNDKQREIYRSRLARTIK